MRATGERESERQREDLLSAAWQVAARDGLSACTYRGVAAEAGTSPTPFIRHFPTREVLLAALFDEMGNRFEAARGEDVVTSDPLEAVIAEGAQILSGRPKMRDCNRVAFDLSFYALRDPKMRRRVKARDAELGVRWLKNIQEARGLGTVREDRPAAEVADQLGSLLSGLVFANLIYPKRLPSDHVRRLWEDGAMRIVDPATSPGVHQRLVVPEAPLRTPSFPGERRTSRREELLDVAFRVTARDGLSGLSFRRLAEEAGTSTTPFTYAFGSRQRLLAAMVRETWETSAELQVMASRIESPVDRFFAEWAEQLSDDPRQVDLERVYYELHHQALTNPALAKLMREGDQYGFAVALPLIEQGCDQGLVRGSVPATDILDELLALFDGVGLRRLLLGEKRPAGYRIGIWEDGGRRLLAP